ncbi:MAK10-like protein [Tanacetum coccineum]
MGRGIQWKSVLVVKIPLLLLSRRGCRVGIQTGYRFLALGWLLEEIHVNWAHLEKKQTRLRTYTKSLEDLYIQCLSFLCVNCFVIHSHQPPWETQILSVTLEITPTLPQRHNKNTLSSLYGTKWYLSIRSDTIGLVENGCSFHGLQSEDPNQDLKDLLKLMNSLDLNGENRERTRLRLFQFSLRNQARNWLERLPAGSITTWEDLTIRFLAQFFPPGRTVKLRNDILIRTIDQSAGGKLRDRNAKESWALLEDLSLYDNESLNDPRDFAKPVKAISFPQDVPSTSDHRLIELENQVQRLMEAHLALTQPTQVNKITTSCEICSGPHDTQYCIKDPEEAFVDYASSQTNETGRSQDDCGKRGGILKETEDEIEEEKEDSLKHFDTFPTIKELRYHEWLLKNPRPPWVKAKVRTGNLNNVKFSCMVGHFDKKQAYLDMESLINVMSRLHYNWIMSKRLGPRRKPSNPRKICNFVGRVKGLKIFVGNFTYECDFMVLEDTTSVIDHDLGSVIFRKPFVEATGLVYYKEKGTITFEKDKEKIMFKMPHKMEMFKHIDFTDIKTDRIPPFAIESNDDSSEKTHYSDSLDLGSEYKHDENVCRAIQSLIAMKAKRNKGEVTLYLTIKSLEVLRKFHRTILGGRFNQLSHVSSPLLSKPGEY